MQNIMEGTIREDELHKSVAHVKHSLDPSKELQ